MFQTSSVHHIVNMSDRHVTISAGGGCDRDKATAGGYNTAVAPIGKVDKNLLEQ